MAQEYMNIDPREMALKEAVEALGWHALIMTDAATGAVVLNQPALNARLVANGHAESTEAEAIALKESNEFKQAQADKASADAKLAADSAAANDLEASVIPADAANIERLKGQFVNLQDKAVERADRLSVSMNNADLARAALASAQAADDEAQRHLAEDQVAMSEITDAMANTNAVICAAEEKLSADQRALEVLGHEIASDVQGVADAEAAVIKEGKEAEAAAAHVAAVHAALARNQGLLDADNAAIAAAKAAAALPPVAIDIPADAHTDTAAEGAAPVADAPAVVVTTADEGHEEGDVSVADAAAAPAVEEDRGDAPTADEGHEEGDVSVADAAAVAAVEEDHGDALAEEVAVIVEPVADASAEEVPSDTIAVADVPAEDEAHAEEVPSDTIAVADVPAEDESHAEEVPADTTAVADVPVETHEEIVSSSEGEESSSEEGDMPALAEADLPPAPMAPTDGVATTGDAASEDDLPPAPMGEVALVGNAEVQSDNI